VSLVLRDATVDDLDDLLSLESRCYLPEQTYSREEYRYSLARAKAVNLGIWDGKLPIGFVGAFHHATHKLGHVYTINVDPHRRGEGLGKRLMAACEDRMRALGMRRMVLEVNVENVEGIRLYERCGYTRVERIRNYYRMYKNNDAFVYAKDLAPRVTRSSSPSGR
jgi:[ribosomal protein S18]-alanine N-acetyltransferase